MTDRTAERLARWARQRGAFFLVDTDGKLKYYRDKGKKLDPGVLRLMSGDNYYRIKEWVIADAVTGGDSGSDRVP